MPTNKPGSIASITIGGKTFNCYGDEDAQQDSKLGSWEMPKYIKIDTSTLSEDDVEFLKRHASGDDNAN